MIDWHKYEKRGWYPHMKPNDVAIWERFIEKYPGKYTMVLYDFECGESYPVEDDTPDNMRADWKILGQKKIDVVGKTAEGFDVIEVKPRASLGALGQCLAYKWLYESEEIPDLPCTPTIITDVLLPDMARVAAAHGVQIFVV